MINLGRVNQEGMTKIHCPRLSDGHDFGSPRSCTEIQIHQGNARLSRRLKNFRHLQMRTNPDTCGCLLLTDVRK